MLKTISDEQIAEGCERLSAMDNALAVACEAIAFRPHIRTRTPGYEGLFRIIVAQQVSVPSAQSIQARCDSRIRHYTPDTVIRMTEADLRLCGLSGPKIRYVQGVARAVIDGALDLTALPAMDDEEACRHLCSAKGIGPWSAAIYLLFCDRRMDIWPKGDVALLAAYAAASGFGSKPAMKDFDFQAEKWAPWRGMAAHILWTYYAKLRGREPI